MLEKPAPVSARKPADIPNISEAEVRRAAQEARYAENGVTPEIVLEMIDEVKIFMERNVTLDFSRSFYLNSSDPLNEMRKGLGEIEGRHVVTVAGAGDFPQLFIEKGASSIEIFDISAFAAFWTELKLQALSVFSYTEYKNFLGRSDSLLYETGAEKSRTEMPLATDLFNSELYLRLRESLSKQARTCFDEIIKDENRDMFAPSVEVDRYEHFARTRGEGFVSSCVTSEAQYNALRSRVRSIPWIISVGDISDYTRNSWNNGDIFYMSNIGIHARNVLEYAERIYASGCNRVVLSFINEEDHLGYPFEKSSEYYLDQDGNINYISKKKINKNKKKNSNRSTPLYTVDGVPVVVGAIISLRTFGDENRRLKVVCIKRGGAELVAELFVGYSEGLEGFTPDIFAEDVESWLETGLICRYSEPIQKKAQEYIDGTNGDEIIKKVLLSRPRGSARQVFSDFFKRLNVSAERIGNNFSSLVQSGEWSWNLSNVDIFIHRVLKNPELFRNIPVWEYIKPQLTKFGLGHQLFSLLDHFNIEDDERRNVAIAILTKKFSIDIAKRFVEHGFISFDEAVYVYSLHFSEVQDNIHDDSADWFSADEKEFIRILEQRRLHP